MTKTIYEKAVAYGHEHMGCCNIEDFENGAVSALDEIEVFMGGYELPKNPLAKLVVLDVFSDIHHKIEELKK